MMEEFPKGHHFFRFFQRIIFTAIILNLVYLNYLMMVERNKPTPPLTTVASMSKSDSGCDETCIDNIYEDIYQATTSASSKVAIAQSTITKNNNTIKEFFIPFGSGFSSASEWTDIPGMQTSLDTANYSRIKQAFFEATVRIPTGNETAYVRLFNVTDKHPVWYSDVSAEGGTPVLVTSQPINLDIGTKIYQVQMKTSLSYQAFIDQSRIRVVTE